MTITPHILCVSLNPAIDRRLRLPSFHAGEVNRATSVDPAAGGKAAHVAYAAAALGAHVTWLAVLGGPEGDACRAGVQARGVEALVVPIAGRTRTNLEIIDQSSGTITEVLEPGPAVSEEELAALRKKFAEQLPAHPVVVLSGSLPKGVAATFYADLVATARRAGSQVLLDASGDSLAAALSAVPDAIKPNRQEAAALLGKPIGSISEAYEAAKSLRAQGPQTVLLSLGAEGAIAVADHALLATAPPIEAVSTVGSGDSFLAGWAVATAQNLPLPDRLRLAIACGTANCLAPSPGVIFPEDVKTYANLVEIRSI